MEEEKIIYGQEIVYDEENKICTIGEKLFHVIDFNRYFCESQSVLDTTLIVLNSSHEIFKIGILKDEYGEQINSYIIKLIDDDEICKISQELKFSEDMHSINKIATQCNLKAPDCEFADYED